MIKNIKINLFSSCKKPMNIRVSIKQSENRLIFKYVDKNHYRRIGIINHPKSNNGFDALDRDIVDGRSIYNPSLLRALEGCYSRRYKRPFPALKLESTPTTSGREKLFHHLTRKVALAQPFLSGLMNFGSIME